MAPRNVGTAADAANELVTRAELTAAAGTLSNFVIDGGTWTTDHTDNLIIDAGGWT